MKHSILVVEDNPDILAANCYYLTQLGYAVDSATSAEDAKRRMKNRRYSIVLSDVHLRDLSDSDGVALAEYIDRNLYGTPVILLTACGDPDVFLKAMQCGVIRVLSKPQPMSQVASVIRETLLNTYGHFNRLFADVPLDEREMQDPQDRPPCQDTR